LVIAADDRISKMKVFNRGLEFAAVVFGYSTAVDNSQFVRLADGAIGIQQPDSKGIESGSALEDQVVTVLDLGEKDAVLTANGVSFPFREERGEIAKPFLAARNQVIWQQGI
jgi:hypothetical protein